MARMKYRGGEIKGHLDSIITDNEDEFEGDVQKWQEVLIHGDPAGLKSFAKLLLKIANLDQENFKALSVGAKEHYHLRPNFETGKNSVQAIVGRLDAKGTGDFYDGYVVSDRFKN